MTDSPPTLLRRGGPWARVVIFISLYIMLLESLTEWVLVIYLYVIQQVDSKMTPSLVLALVAVCINQAYLERHIPSAANHCTSTVLFHRSARGPS